MENMPLSIGEKRLMASELEKKTKFYENVEPHQFSKHFDGLEEIESIEISLLKELAQRERKGRVLDIGCGTGRLSKVFPKDNYIGIDTAKAFLDYLNVEKRRDNIHLILGDMDALPFKENNLDLILLVGTLESDSDPVGRITQLHRYLSGKGKIIITFSNSRNLRVRARCRANEPFKCTMFSRRYIRHGLSSLAKNYQLRFIIRDYWVISPPFYLKRKLPRGILRVLVKLSLLLDKVNNLLHLELGSTWMICIEAIQTKSRQQV